MAEAVELVYGYRGQSVCCDGEVGLAVSGDEIVFLSAWFEEPAVLAAGLLTVARCARERFFNSGAGRFADPVVTCAPGVVRFESLSSCAGVYARLDVDLSDADVRAGTTNVDFNPPMRSALARVDNRAPLHLRIGAEAVSVLTPSGAVEERRVPLPARWVQGFSEAGVIQATMSERLDLDGPNGMALLRSAGSVRDGGAWHVTPNGRGARLTKVASARAAAAGGLNRLRLFEPLLPYVQCLRVFGAHDGAASGWVLGLPGMRLSLVLSPELWRGFSGEGAAASATDEAMAAAHGRAGFDLARGAFFERVLPFDLSGLESGGRRMAAARKLVAAGGVRLDGDRAWVAGSDGVEHRVRHVEGDEACTCEWWARHPGDRGLCRHLLAARLLVTDG